MLRKKLIALGLIGMTVMSITTSNTIISIAAPTNAESSDDMMQKVAERGLNSLERLLNEGNHKEADGWKKEVQHQLKDLRKSGEDVTDLQNRLDKLSKQLDLLKKNKKKIEGTKLSVRDLIRDIMYSLYLNDYDPIPHMFTVLFRNIEELSNHGALEQSTLDRVEKLKFKYDNRELLDKFEDMINLIKPQLDNLSKFIKEKNLNKSILAKKQISSAIENIEDSLKVPEHIKNKFELYCEKVDELVVLKERAIILKNEIHLLLNKADKLIDIKDHKIAKKYIDKALERVATLDKLEDTLDEPLSKRLTYIKDRFDNLEVEILSPQLSPPVNEMQSTNLGTLVPAPRKPKKVKPVDLNLMENHEKEGTQVKKKLIYTKENNVEEEVTSTKLVDSKDNDEKEEVTSTKLVDSKDNDEKEEVTSTKLVDSKDNDKKEEVTSTKLVDPK